MKASRGLVDGSVGAATLYFLHLSTNEGGTTVEVGIEMKADKIGMK
jgi:hypothetical protein